MPAAAGRVHAPGRRERMHSTERNGILNVMIPSHPLGRALACLALTFALAGPPSPARAADAPPDTMVVQHPEVVVSATRTPRKQVDLPNATAVVTGAELRRRGVRTLAEALQGVAGLDTGEGSDNGGRLPNVGMWGLKEFDALLFTLNGVPVGGPFNPSLAQIPIEDIERIEVLKGPQGTMYGVSAFAGMISVYTRQPASGGEIAAGGGSFEQGGGHFNWGRSLPDGQRVSANGSFYRTGGWQDRTEGESFRGGLTYGFDLGEGRMTLDLMGVNDEQDWGSPLPYEDGVLLKGFRIDRNYAVGGAEVKHRVFGATSRLTWPVGAAHRFENTLGWTSDRQDYLRSFPGEVMGGDTLESTALELEPTESSLYEDARFLANFEAGGRHELVTGASLTWGETKGDGREFEFDQLLSAYPMIPSAARIAGGDDREFEDRRTFFGLYAHDAWTPHERLTLEGGLRFDAVREELETEADLAGGPVPVRDEREDSDVSGDVSALVRLLPKAGVKDVQTVNLYGSVRRAFKPAAPNLAEAEAAEILEPEHTTSWEVGMKTRAFRQVALDLSYFDMTFENVVVSILGAGGGPELTNAGKERFKGFEASLHWAPAMLSGSSIDVGYAHHDARFVDFTFVTPDSVLRDVGGNRLELVPREMVNVRINGRSPLGLGAWAALRYQGERPFNRRNTFFADAFTEWDAGASYERGAWRVAVTGRNLGDDRHVVTESEIGDSQFYVAPPRRVTGEVAWRF